MSRVTKKSAKAHCDRLFSEMVRSLGYCEKCGSTQYLNCCHIISRKYGVTRTDFHNVYCLCARCHRYFHDYPRDFSHFISDSALAQYYDEVFAKAQEGGKMDWFNEVERLKGLKNLTLEELRNL